MLILLISFTLFLSISCDSIVTNTNNNTIFYFGYGSNLLAKRIHINNPSAVFYGPAKLNNYRLDFAIYTDLWDGCSATIVEDDEEEVWGALWIFDVSEIEYLDQQEEVHSNMYYAKNVTVTTPDGKVITARTYQETVDPYKINRGDYITFDRRPSSTYLGVITLGAIESRLPAEYIAYIFSIPSNGRMATKTMRDKLGYPF